MTPAARPLLLTIIDDDPPVRFALTHLFSHDPRYTIHSAHSRLTTTTDDPPPDLALVDLSTLPPDPAAVLAAFSSQHPETAIFVLSAHPDLGSLQQALLHAGADATLSKTLHLVTLPDQVWAAWRDLVANP